MMPTTKSKAPGANTSRPVAQVPKDKFVLTSKKCIDFYSKNPHIDFNVVNEIYIDLVQKFASSNGNIFKVDEMKNVLTAIDKKISVLENNISQNNTMIKMTHDNLNDNKDFYTQQHMASQLSYFHRSVANSVPVDNGSLLGFMSFT